MTRHYHTGLLSIDQVLFAAKTDIDYCVYYCRNTACINARLCRFLESSAGDLGEEQAGFLTFI